MHTRIILSFFVLIFALSATALAQEPTEEEKATIAQADEYFFNRNYKAARELYTKLLEKYPEDTKVNYNLGLCYLNSDFEKIESVPYFQKVLFYEPEEPNLYYLIGKAYQYDHQFDRAIDMFNSFKEYYGSYADFTLQDADDQIMYCENAYQLLKFPVNCTYENLGPSINSKYPDYFPFVTTDERFLMFNTKRDDGSSLQRDGTYASNIYFTKVVDGEFAPAVPVPGPVNKPAGNEVVIGMSGDGSKVLLMEGLDGVSGDILEADFVNGELTAPTVFSDRINTKYREIAASISADGNTIYFTSDRPDGYGGTDIWVTKKLPTGAWGVPFNLGPHVNTEFDEDFPNISPDGEHLYFSSKGHFSMGGYDIFKSKWNADSNRFDNPRNIGYPINSVGDDMNYRASRTGRYGYISALRPEGFGDYDIYRLTINEVEPEFSVIKGVVSSADPKMEVDAPSITVTNIQTGEIGLYAPNPRTMRYIIILAPGEYEVIIEADGFQAMSYEVKVLGKSSFQAEVDQDVVMVPN